MSVKSAITSTYTERSLQLAEQKLRIEREWAMSSPWTFTIKPVLKLLKEEMTPGVWVDPYAGHNSPAQYQNDINPESPAGSHIDALDYLKSLSDAMAEGILYDPPYSPRQIKECYTAIGIKPTFEMFNAGYNGKIKRQISRIVKPGGKVICCGWNTNGIGKHLGFQLYRILIIPHGSSKNDTLVTVERKANGSLF